MLDRELKYFNDNKEMLTKQYLNKYIVIVDESVEASYDSEDSAYMDSLAKYGEGKFMIQFCNSKGESQTQTFHSRVSFLINA